MKTFERLREVHDLMDLKKVEQQDLLNGLGMTWTSSLKKAELAEKLNKIWRQVKTTKLKDLIRCKRRTNKSSPAEHDSGYFAEWWKDKLVKAGYKLTGHETEADLASRMVDLERGGNVQESPKRTSFFLPEIRN